MNTMWSDFVQTSAELYQYRGLKFRADNQSDWLPKCKIKDGMSVLELGCASGQLLHCIKTLLPHTVVTGVDRDDGHIAFAKQKTAELDLDCNFVVGDALALPFGDNTFDLTFSHTVIGHVDTHPFLKEQYRVLKKGGLIAVLSVCSNLNYANENWKPPMGEESDLLKKAWSQWGDFDKENGIGVYDVKIKDYPFILAQAGFTHINIDFTTLLPYAPDNNEVSSEMALAQINANRQGTLACMGKALRRCPDALTEAEKQRLTFLINQRYDERIALYQKGEKVWDMATSTILIATGRKE